jgi:hypothetical protein
LVHSKNLTVPQLYARTEVLRGFALFANLTLPTGRIVLGGGPSWDPVVGAGAGAGGSVGAFNTKLSIETPATRKVSIRKADTEWKKGVLTLSGVRHLVDPDQAVADLKHVIPERPSSEQRSRIILIAKKRS